jgi:hypothetical protein
MGDCRRHPEQPTAFVRLGEHGVLEERCGVCGVSVALWDRRTYPFAGFAADLPARMCGCEAPATCEVFDGRSGASLGFFCEVCAPRQLRELRLSALGYESPAADQIAQNRVELGMQHDARGKRP